MGKADDKDSAEPALLDFLGMSRGVATPAVRARSDGAPGSGGGRVVETAEGSVSASAASAGASSGGCGLASRRSTEKQRSNNFESFRFHGGSDISVPEVSNRFLGRKRNSSDSAFMGFEGRIILPMASDSPETSHMVKMRPDKVMDEISRRSQEEDLVLAMQPPPRPNSTSIISHPTVIGSPVTVASKWGWHIPRRSSSKMRGCSQFVQGMSQMDKISSCVYKDSIAGAVLSSQVATDEGSRTGTQGAGVLNVIDSGFGNGDGEGKSAGTYPSNKEMKATSQITEPESSNTPSRHCVFSTMRQMTIFYDGQAHVFDDVNPNKANIIMALAGSNEGSRSTSYSAKPVHPRASDAKLSGAKKFGNSNLPFDEECQGG